MVSRRILLLNLKVININIYKIDYVTKNGGTCTTNIRSFTAGYVPAKVGGDTNHNIIVIG
jgi:hypothetical protein